MTPRPALTEPRRAHNRAARRGTGLRRRLMGAGAAAATAATVAVAAAAGPAAAAGSTLKAAAEAQGRYFGTEVTGSMPSNPTIANLAGQQFDMVTPGNEMKWDTTEPSNGSFNFRPGDTIVSFAQSHGMRVRCHNLAWDSQLPAW